MNKNVWLGYLFLLLREESGEHARRKEREGYEDFPKEDRKQMSGH